MSSRQHAPTIITAWFIVASSLPAVAQTPLEIARQTPAPSARVLGSLDHPLLKPLLVPHVCVEGEGGWSQSQSLPRDRHRGARPRAGRGFSNLCNPSGWGRQVRFGTRTDWIECRYLSGATNERANTDEEVIHTPAWSVAVPAA